MLQKQAADAAGDAFDAFRRQFGERLAENHRQQIHELRIRDKDWPTGREQQLDELLPAVVAGWRARWQDPERPTAGE